MKRDFMHFAIELVYWLLVMGVELGKTHIPSE